MAKSKFGGSFSFRANVHKIIGEMQKVETKTVTLKSNLEMELSSRLTKNNPNVFPSKSQAKFYKNPTNQHFSVFGNRMTLTSSNGVMTTFSTIFANNQFVRVVRKL